MRNGPITVKAAVPGQQQHELVVVWHSEPRPVQHRSGAQLDNRQVAAVPDGARLKSQFSHNIWITYTNKRRALSKAQHTARVRSHRAETSVRNGPKLKSKSPHRRRHKPGRNRIRNNPIQHLHRAKPDVDHGGTPGPGLGVPLKERDHRGELRPPICGLRLAAMINAPVSSKHHACGPVGPGGDAERMGGDSAGKCPALSAFGRRARAPPKHVPVAIARSTGEPPSEPPEISLLPFGHTRADPADQRWGLETGVA